MASNPLVLPGVLFVGEDERQRLTAHTGPAAGWMAPKGILQWSTEVSVVPREALTEDIRKEIKAVMPEEQIPPAKYPLTLEAAKRSPLVAVSSKLTSKLAELNVRVHTIGVDRMTSSFFYIAEGGGEEALTVSGDLVQAVAEMLGERADNAAIERVMDSIVDRLLISLSKGRVTELGVELAAALPRAANDGSGAKEVDLDQFEKDLAGLVGASEKYGAHLQEVADKIIGSTERKVDVPLYVDARKVPQGPFELSIGDRKVPLATYERWVMTGPFTEPTGGTKPAAATPAAATPAAATPAKAEPKPEPKAEAKPEPKKETPKPAESKPKLEAAAAKATTPRPADAKANDKGVEEKRTPTPAPAKAAALAAPIAPTNKGASDRPPAPRPATKSRPDIEVPAAAAAAGDGGAIQPMAVVSIGSPSTEPLPAPPRESEEKAAEPAAAAAATEEPKKAAQKTLPLGAVFDSDALAAAASAPKEKDDDAEAKKVQQKTMPLNAVYDPKVFEAAKAAEDARRAKESAEEDAKKQSEPKVATPAKAAKAAEASAPAAKQSPQAKDLAKDEKKGGFPWLIVLIVIALAVVIYQVVLSKK